MMKKVLFVATVDSHIELFHLPYLKMFKDKGYEVHVATDSDKPIRYCDRKIKLPIKRGPFKISNLKAIRELKKVLNDEKYEIVHCHTPMGGVVARLAAKKARKNGTRVIYTAHGFHFYKGAPLHYWMIFYPVEKWLSRYTDTLITINQEDYERAKRKFSKRCLDIQYVPGVGVDPKKFEKKMSEKEKNELRKSLGLSSGDKVLIFPAELSKRKNQIWLIKTLKPLFDEDKNHHLLLPGKDSLNGKCQKLAKELGLGGRIHFLGFRDDILKLLQISDVALSSSKQEGLPVNLIEAAMADLPIVATDCRGNRDVCEKYKGKVVEKDDGKTFVESVKELQKNNASTIARKDAFLLNNVSKHMSIVYGFDIVATDDEKLSIIVPVHNSEKYVERCLKSLCEQDYQNIEIVVVVDNSSDNSLRKCQEFARKDSRIIVKCVNFNNVSKTRNYGLNVCSGRFIGFADSDDYVDKQMYLNMIRMIKNRDVDIVVCAFDREMDGEKVEHDSNVMPDKFFSKEDYLDEMQQNKQMQGYVWNRLYKRELICDNTVSFDDDISIMEDDLFNYRVFEKNNNFMVGYLPDRLYHYVIHCDGLSKSNYDIKKMSMFEAKLREIEIAERLRWKTDFLKAEYVSLFARDSYLMKRNLLCDTAEYKKLRKIFIKYKNDTTLKGLPLYLCCRFLVAKYQPYLYKIWLIKNNRFGGGEICR